MSSSLIFDPSTGLVSPATEDIRTGIVEDWVKAFEDPDLPVLDTDPTTPAGQLIDGEVAEIEAKNAAMLFLANQFDPRSSEGIWQDALGYIYFLTRKLDEPTVVTCQLTGLRGTVIPYGSLVQSQNGYTLICNNAISLRGDGTDETTFRVSETGAIDIPANSVTSIITTRPGWDTVNNEAAGAVGRDLETRSEFEARRANSVAANAHGSVGAIFGTIANLPGVLAVQVLENISPNPIIRFGVIVPAHGVTVCVYGGENDAIAEAIYNKKDNGADTGGNTPVRHTASEFAGAVYEYLILRPDTINFWIKVTFGAGNTLTPSVINAIKQALYDDFHGRNTSSGNARVTLASTVFASRFYCPVLAIEGAKNIQQIEIALSITPPSTYYDFVTINGDQMPVVTIDNIQIVGG